MIKLLFIRAFVIEFYMPSSYETVTLHNTEQVVTISLIGPCLEKDMAFVNTIVFVFLTLAIMGARPDHV